MVIGITEVKAKNCSHQPLVSEYNMEWNKDYTLFEKKLGNDNGRGLILYANKALNAEEVKMETKFEENLFVRIKVSYTDSVLVGLVYRSLFWYSCKLERINK